MGGRLFGLGLAGALVGSPAFGQFASDRREPAPAAPAAPPAVVQPAATVPAPVPSSAPRALAAIQAPQAAYLSHPLGVRPGHGAFMICVQSYTGPQSRESAEQLAEHVRTVHKAAAYLFEYGGEERAREEAKQARARQFERERNEPFLQQQAAEQDKAKREGRAFAEQPLKLRVPKVVIPEQWAVLVGGFPSGEEARRALDVVRKWPPPAERLMDQQFSVGGPAAQGTFINPFAAAKVFPNPAIKQQAGPVTADPALVKLNADEPLSLLKAPGKFTLLVKTFSSKTSATGRDEQPGLLDRLLGKGGEESATLLQANAHDARVLAEALRDPRMHKSAQEAADKFCTAYGHKPFPVPPLTAYVLHTRTGSLVTVGGFETEDGDDLVAAGRILQYMEMQVTFKDKRTEQKRMFDNVIPVPIPRP